MMKVGKAQKFILKFNVHYLMDLMGSFHIFQENGISMMTSSVQNHLKICLIG